VQDAFARPPGCTEFVLHTNCAEPCYSITCIRVILNSCSPAAPSAQGGSCAAPRRWPPFPAAPPGRLWAEGPRMYHTRGTTSRSRCVGGSHLPCTRGMDAACSRRRRPECEFTCCPTIVTSRRQERATSGGELLSSPSNPTHPGRTRAAPAPEWDAGPRAPVGAPICM